MSKTWSVCLLAFILPAAAAGQQRVQAIGTPTAWVRYQSVQDRVTTVASLATDPATLREVTAHFSGWIEQTPVNTPYQRVQQGEVLCTIYSPELYAAEQDYLSAVRNASALTTSSVPGVASGAAALLADARQRLAQLQVPPAEITRLEHGGAARQRFAVEAPETGIVQQRAALPGMRVVAGTRLYTLSALQPIWANALVQESDLGRIRAGQAATLRLDAFPERQYQARVAFVEPQVESDSRTARVRLVLPNTDLALAPGMYGTAIIAVPLGRRLVVPASAVLQSGTGALAFVALGNGRFDPRPVQTGAQVGSDIVIRHGLRAGERVALGATFLVASEAQLAAAAGAYAPPPPGVSAHAAQPGAASVQATLTTAPSPARKGANTFRAYVTTSTGVPVAGATVTLHLSLPAMPAMGMAGMAVTVPLREQGGGYYSGSGILASGGTWQARVEIRKHGALVGLVMTSLTVTGGM